MGCFKFGSKNDLLNLISRANDEETVDIIEIRVDYLAPSSWTPELFAKIKSHSTKPILLAFRNVQSDEIQNGDQLTHQQLQLMIQTAIQLEYNYIDCEHTDFIHTTHFFKKQHLQTKFIISYHGQLMNEKSTFIEFIYNLQQFSPDYIKIVFSSYSPEESSQIEILQVFSWNQYPNLHISLFGMGNNCRNSRMLGYMFNNPFTYVALDAEHATAEGQFSLEEFHQYEAIYQSMNIGLSPRIQLFGESHGYEIGCLIHGLALREPFPHEFIQSYLHQRRPGQNSLQSPRKELDQLEITNGVTNGTISGKYIRLVIKNTNFQSTTYHQFRSLPRPSHVDYPARLRFGNHISLSGGGLFSGRLTAPLVMAGAICIHRLSQHHIKILAYTSQIGSVKDDQIYTIIDIEQYVRTNILHAPNPHLFQEMKKIIETVQSEKDSIGGQISVIIENVPGGWGNPWFHSLESELAKIIFGIPGVRGIEFGTGFKAAEMRGSDHNDPYIFQARKLSTRSNHAGGIVGGISLGTPIRLQIAVKPTASIGQPQETLNFDTMKQDMLKIIGRHDPCIVPRLIPVVEAAIAIIFDNYRISFKK